MRDKHTRGGRTLVSGIILRADDDQVVPAVLVATFARCFEQDSEGVTSIWVDEDVPRWLDLAVFVCHDVGGSAGVHASPARLTIRDRTGNRYDDFLAVWWPQHRRRRCNHNNRRCRVYGGWIGGEIYGRHYDAVVLIVRGVLHSGDDNATSTISVRWQVGFLDLNAPGRPIVVAGPVEANPEIGGSAIGVHAREVGGVRTVATVWFGRKVAKSSPCREAARQASIRRCIVKGQRVATSFMACQFGS
jgi:hypothetical protein